MSCCSIGGNENPSTRISPTIEAVVSIIAVTLIAIAGVAFFYGNLLLAIGTVGLGGTISICEIVYRLHLCTANKKEADEESSSRSERTSSSSDFETASTDVSSLTIEDSSSDEAEAPAQAPFDQTRRDLNSSQCVTATESLLMGLDISAIPNATRFDGKE